MAGFDDADVVITIGYDLVEHAPEHWNPRRDKKIVVIDSVAAEIDEFFLPEVELIGDIAHVLTRLADGCRTRPRSARSRARAGCTTWSWRAPERFARRRPLPVCARLGCCGTSATRSGRDDMLVSDVGLHKLWIGRMFPAHEPGTVLIANGLAGMGFALPTAIAAKLVHPDRKVVTVTGDGGFLMNCQELETAVRLRTPIVNVVWENHAVRLDRVEAGQEVRPPLRRRLRQPRFRQAGRGVRNAGLALRPSRRVRAAD